MSRDSRREELEAEFGNAVRAYQTGVDNFDQAMADHIGINRTDGRCVDLIDQAGGMTAGELAKAAGLTTGPSRRSSTAWRRPASPSACADPSDRRRVRIEATPKLWELTEPLLGPMLDESQTIVDDLSDNEIARFTTS